MRSGVGANQSKWTRRKVTHTCHLASGRQRLHLHVPPLLQRLQLRVPPLLQTTVVHQAKGPVPTWRMSCSATASGAACMILASMRPRGFIVTLASFCGTDEWQ